MHRSIKFDEETYALIEEMAKEEGRTTASLIRSLLSSHPAVVGYRVFKESGWQARIESFVTKPLRNSAGEVYNDKLDRWEKVSE